MFRLRKILPYVILTFILFSITSIASATPDAHRVQDNVNRLLV